MVQGPTSNPSNYFIVKNSGMAPSVLISGLSASALSPLLTTQQLNDFQDIGHSGVDAFIYQMGLLGLGPSGTLLDAMGALIKTAFGERKSNPSGSATDLREAVTVFQLNVELVRSQSGVASISSGPSASAPSISLSTTP